MTGEMRQSSSCQFIVGVTMVIIDYHKRKRSAIYFTDLKNIIPKYFCKKKPPAEISFLRGFQQIKYILFCGSHPGGLGPFVTKRFTINNRIPFS